jgi:hypothetical protein
MVDEQNGEAGDPTFKNQALRWGRCACILVASCAPRLKLEPLFAMTKMIQIFNRSKVQHERHKLGILLWQK